MLLDRSISFSSSICLPPSCQSKLNTGPLHAEANLSFILLSQYEYDKSELERQVAVVKADLSRHQLFWTQFKQKARRHMRATTPGRAFDDDGAAAMSDDAGTHRSAGRWSARSSISTDSSGLENVLSASQLAAVADTMGEEVYDQPRIIASRAASDDLPASEVQSLHSFQSSSHGGRHGNVLSPSALSSISDGSVAAAAPAKPEAEASSARVSEEIEAGLQPPLVAGDSYRSGRSSALSVQDSEDSGAAPRRVLSLSQLETIEIPSDLAIASRPQESSVAEVESSFAGESSHLGQPVASAMSNQYTLDFEQYEGFATPQRSTAAAPAAAAPATVTSSSMAATSPFATPQLNDLQRQVQAMEAALEAKRKVVLQRQLQERLRALQEEDAELEQIISGQQPPAATLMHREQAAVAAERSASSGEGSQHENIVLDVDRLHSVLSASASSIEDSGKLDDSSRQQSQERSSQTLKASAEQLRTAAAAADAVASGRASIGGSVATEVSEGDIVVSDTGSVSGSIIASEPSEVVADAADKKPSADVDEAEATADATAAAAAERRRSTSPEAAAGPEEQEDEAASISEEEPGELDVTDSIASDINLSLDEGEGRDRSFSVELPHPAAATAAKDQSLELPPAGPGTDQADAKADAARTSSSTIATDVPASISASIDVSYTADSATPSGDLQTSTAYISATPAADAAAAAEPSAQAAAADAAKQPETAVDAAATDSKSSDADSIATDVSQAEVVEEDSEADSASYAAVSAAKPPLSPKDASAATGFETEVAAAAAAAPSAAAADFAEEPSPAAAATQPETPEAPKDAAAKEASPAQQASEEKASTQASVMLSPPMHLQVSGTPHSERYSADFGSDYGMDSPRTLSVDEDFDVSSVSCDCRCFAFFQCCRILLLTFGKC